MTVATVPTASAGPVPDPVDHVLDTAWDNATAVALPILEEGGDAIRDHVPTTEECQQPHWPGIGPFANRPITPEVCVYTNAYSCDVLVYAMGLWCVRVP